MHVWQCKNVLCFLRGFAQPHGVVALADDLLARAVQKLSQPADAAHEEAGVDVEQDDRRVTVGVLPVGQERRLEWWGGETMDGNY